MICAACGTPTNTQPCTACGAEPRISGRYRLDRELGQGSTGVVYAGVDEHTGEAVAVKQVALGRLDHDKARELARREGRVLRQLHHPGIPQWHHEAIVGTGRATALCLVQELVSGTDLESGLADHRWSEAEAVALMLEALDILDHLHTRHPPVLHRDVKPSNLIRRDDGQLVLIDFGAVRDALRDADLGGSTVAGTFGYMAPEQFAGHAVPATDHYALAMTSVALLSRRSPTELHDRAGRLQWRDAVSLSPGFTALLAAMLDPDPEARPPTAAIRRRLSALAAGDTQAEATRAVGPASGDHQANASGPRPTLHAPANVTGSDFFSPEDSVQEVIVGADTPGRHLTRPPASPQRTRRVIAAVVAVMMVTIFAVAAVGWLTLTTSDVSTAPPPSQAPTVVATQSSPPPAVAIVKSTTVTATAVVCVDDTGQALRFGHPGGEQVKDADRTWTHTLSLQVPESLKGQGPVNILCNAQMGFDEQGDVDWVSVEHGECPKEVARELCGDLLDWVHAPLPSGQRGIREQPVRFKVNPPSE